MIATENGLKFIRDSEGFMNHAYLDSAGVPTIGFGSTIYSDGRKIKLGEHITKEEAEKLLQWEVTNKSKVINSLFTTVNLNKNQFDALLSFAYNVGVGALEGSTLRKKVLKNPDDPAIANEFMRWNKIHVKGKVKVLDGLTKRRAEEAKLYFMPDC